MCELKMCTAVQVCLQELDRPGLQHSTELQYVKVNLKDVVLMPP